jgi:hypothetical protein
MDHRLPEGGGQACRSATWPLFRFLVLPAARSAPLCPPGKPGPLRLLLRLLAVFARFSSGHRALQGRARSPRCTPASCAVSPPAGSPAARGALSLGRGGGSSTPLEAAARRPHQERKSCGLLPEELTTRNRPTARSSGEGGIRTRGTFPYTRFPVVHLRPLGHLSRYFFDARLASAVPTPLARERAVGAHLVQLGQAAKRSGESGIRTRGTLAGTPDFESGTFGLSVTSPRANMAK